MLKEMSDFIARFTYQPLQEAVKERIRTQAIENAKARLAVHHQKLDDYTQEELEIIIEDEERKIIDGLKTKSLIAVLSLLGLNLFS